MPGPRKPDVEKYCQACGVRLHRKRFNERLEDNRVFNRRKYCDRLCMAAAMTMDRPTLTALRKRATKLRGERCDACGATEYLGIHHIDLNPANNAGENLMTLCGSCHTSWHWSHGRHRQLVQKSPAPCSICGAVWPRLKRGMCQKHYQRLRKYGDPCLTKIKTGSSYALTRVTRGS